MEKVKQLFDLAKSEWATESVDILTFKNFKLKFNVLGKTLKCKEVRFNFINWYPHWYAFLYCQSIFHFPTIQIISNTFCT